MPRLLGLLMFLILPCSLWAQYDESELIRLAREAVAAEVRRQSPPKPKRRTSPKGVFVTIEVDGKVLGCRGSLSAKSRSLEEEVISAARSAARHDPRYKPLTQAHLKSFKVTVTVIERLVATSGVEGLQPEEGLVLTSGSRKGIVLPWEGKEPQVRLGWAYKKAGVREGASVVLHELIAVRFRG